jgi:hypothetical protein
MARYGADESKSPIHLDLAATKDGITGAANPVKSKISGWLNPLHDESDFVHMRADHENRVFTLAAPGAGDIAVPVDIEFIDERLEAIPRITDDGLLESRDAVKGR